MKSIIILCLCLLLKIGNLSCQTVVPKEISTNQVWTSALSPYYVNTHVKLKSGIQLLIEEGVEIYFTDKYIFTIEGELVVNGSYSNPVNFSNSRLDFGKSSIKYNPNTKTGSQLNYCHFSGQGYNATNYGIKLSGSEIGMFNVVMDSCSHFLYGNRDSSKVYMSYSKLIGHSSLTTYSMKNFNFGAFEKNSFLVLENCLFYQVSNTVLPYLSYIKNCKFIGNNNAGNDTYGDGVKVEYCKEVVISCSEFLHFDQAIEFIGYVNKADDIVLKKNTFDSCGVFLKFNTFNSPVNRLVVESNNFLGYRNYSIYVTPGNFIKPKVLAEFWGNFWNTSDKDEIEAGIYDFLDDSTTIYIFDFNDPLEVKDETCCIKAEPVHVDVDPLHGCSPLKLAINYSHKPSQSILINTGDGNVYSDTMLSSIEYKEVGEYNLRFIFRDTIGCKEIDTLLFNVRVEKVSKASFETKFIGCSGDLLLENLSDLHQDYWWTFDDSIHISDFEPRYNLGVNEKIKVQLIVNKNGICPDSLSKEVQFVANPDLENLKLYNVFTPGEDDGVNKYFQFEGVSEDCYSIHTYIYNRWGILIYESTKLSDKWDGTSAQGKECPAGTYYVLYRFEDKHTKDKVTMISGVVEIIR